MEPIVPHANHLWLQKFVGEWTAVCDAPPGADPGATPPPWTETVRSLNGLWIVAEGRGEMPGGGAATMVTTLGYDPHKDRFVGTWIGTMMTHQWVYEGVLDDSGRTLVLDTRGPDMSKEGTVKEGTMVRYQDIVTFEDDDNRVMRSQTLGEDGVWKPFMTARFRRNV